MVGVPGVPAGTAQTCAAAHKFLTQSAVQPIYVAQLDIDPWLVLVAWDCAIGGQEDQEGGGQCRSLKAHLGRRTRETLRAGLPDIAFLIAYMQEGEKEGAW